MAKRVVISGATGFIGQVLCQYLQGDYEVIALSRDARKGEILVGEFAKVVEWDARTASNWAGQVEGASAIVNLAGENIASGRWTPSKRAGIVQSRTNSALAVVDAVSGAKKKPAVVIQGSAVGYYGSRGDETLEEDSAAGTAFLAGVCKRTEATAARVERSGVRYVAIRSGAVLGSYGGMLPKIMTPFRFFLGGRVGSGRQWLPWISLTDEVRAIRFLMEHPGLNGAFNLTAPNPTTMKQFTKVLGRILHRPAWTVLPDFAARLAVGQMVDEVLLASERVIPRRLTEAGFEFTYPDLGDALRAIIEGEDDESG